MEPMSDASTYEYLLMNKAKKHKFPINGSIELTPLCNMNCDMCYVRLKKEDTERMGKVMDADKWLSLGADMKDAGVVFLLLTGGEPLLHPEFRKIYLGLRNLGMIITINTNGTLIDESWADFFLEYPPRGINITLYGSSGNTYHKLCHYYDGYEKTMNALHLLTERKLDVRMGCSVTNYNKDDLERIYSIGKKIGVFTIADPYMVPATRERRSEFAYDVRCNPEVAAKNRLYILKQMYGKEQYYKSITHKMNLIKHLTPKNDYGKVNCYAGNCSFAISWLGTMHPCVTMDSPEANVWDMGFKKAWSYISEQVSNIKTSSKCEKCNLKPICSNCAGNAFAETGTYDGTPDYLCRYAKETYRLMALELGENEEMF